MSSPSAEISSTRRLENPNRHGNFNQEELQEIFLTVEQNLPEQQQENFYSDDIRWDLGNPEHLVIHRSENEGSRSLFDVPEVLVNAIEDQSTLRLERATSLRPRRDSRRRSVTRSPYRASRRSPSPRSPRRSRSPPRKRRRSAESPRRRRRYSSSSSCPSCEGCDDPNCGKEYIELTEDVKRCLIDHPVFGKGFFIRDPSGDAKAWYTPGQSEDYVYPPSTYDVGATRAIFNPIPGFGAPMEFSGNRFRRQRGGRRSRSRPFRRYNYY